VLRIRWMTQVCAIASGQAFATTSGRPCWCQFASQKYLPAGRPKRKERHNPSHSVAAVSAAWVVADT
jgi:hypothetical protein